ncbi:MAG: 5-methyltetrahydrofolate--homocysteine methyltransferase [Prevotellaceae bacterium]|jgi:cobalamin-dependent methionine synthase I|nr:5-methyltetrahydrofolate--homocysteine methyltransferase [Prevotellaceae bacterium]
MILTYTVRDLTPYISWPYFYHTWRVPPRSDEAARLKADADTWLAEHADADCVEGIFRLCPACADGDNLRIEHTLFPLLRQQVPHADGSPLLCLSDFVRPCTDAGGEPADTVGLFATTCHTRLEEAEAATGDPYRRLLAQSLSDRLAEAAAEKMHEYVRRTAWGYAPDERLTTEQLLREEYQGIRPAVGYPSLPDQSVGFLLNDLLHLEQIGITLTENGAMHPHASVSGLMLSHPASRYFAVGPIGDDQLHDYARRRGLPVAEMRKFLAANLPQET